MTLGSLRVGRRTELDVDLLSSRYQIQTNWCAITGAPSCGKSTLIDLLADLGYATVPETARRYLEAEMARGHGIDEIQHDGPVLQRRMAALQLEVERSLPATEGLVLDGSFPSSMAWYRAFGLDPNEILPDCFRHRYALVFVLDRLPLERDGVRFDDEALPVFLDEWIGADHSALGYDIVRVPVMSPLGRLAFVVERLAAGLMTKP